jgi:hypothetical protein
VVAKIHKHQSVHHLFLFTIYLQELKPAQLDSSITSKDLLDSHHPHLSHIDILIIMIRGVLSLHLRINILIVTLIGMIVGLLIDQQFKET